MPGTERRLNKCSRPDELPPSLSGALWRTRIWEGRVGPGTGTIRDRVRAGGSRSGFIIPVKTGNRARQGPGIGKGGVTSREPLARNMEGGSGSHEPVHKPTTDSQLGEDETGDGAVLAPPRHRSGLDEGGLSADPQGRCSRHRRRHGGRLRSEPGSQSSGPSGSHHVWPLSGAAGPSSIHPQGGRLTKTSRPRNRWRLPAVLAKSSSTSSVDDGACKAARRSLSSPT
jgi:hypothetical protein